MKGEGERDVDGGDEKAYTELRFLWELELEFDWEEWHCMAYAS